MDREKATYPFAEGDRFEGEIEVWRADYPERSIIKVALHVNGRRVPLPRSRIHELITALQEAEAESSRQYTELLEELNSGIHEEDPG